MNTPIWTDDCPACGSRRAPAATTEDHRQHSAVYTCPCGQTWTTNRDLKAYNGFEFPANLPERHRMTRFYPQSILSILDDHSGEYVPNLDAIVSNVEIDGDTAVVELSTNEPHEDAEFIVSETFRVTVERITEPEASQ
jgi:hypothetical protein